MLGYVNYEVSKGTKKTKKKEEAKKKFKKPSSIKVMF